MILPAQYIRKLCQDTQLIFPFVERSRIFGMTYGVGPAGYDIRVAESMTLQPGEFKLASSMESFNMPRDILAYVKDKSSWARNGLNVKNTVIEPNWRGYLTLELSNHWSPLQIDARVLEIKAGMPIAQIVFHQLLEPTEIPYNGKYQDQKAGAQEAIFES